MPALFRELRNALRRLIARPGYTALSLAVLGLGLGAMLFMLSMVNSIVLEPLPFPEPERLVAMGHTRDGSSTIGNLTSADLGRLQPELRAVDAVGLYSTLTVALARGGGELPVRYDGSSLSASMFGLIGVQPILGRPFSADDDRPGAPLTVLLGDAAWRSEFEADPGVIGRAVRVNGEDATIIGVMPPDFAFPYTAQAWLPRRFAPEDGQEQQVLARLAPGASLPGLRAELEALAQRFGTELDGGRDVRRLSAVPASHRFVNPTTRQIVWTMFAAGLLVLLLACANAANLQLVRSLSRRRELAVRSALGASRAGLLREVLSESLLLSVASAALGLLFAHWGSHWVIDVFVANDDAPAYFIRPGIDWRMSGFGFLAALLATLAAGLIPALSASRTDVQLALRDGDKGSGGGFARLARGMVVAEIALTVVLLVGTGMLLRGLQQVLAFDFGTRADPESILTARVGLFGAAHADGAAQVRFFERVVERLRANGQVQSASAATALPGTLGDGHELVGFEGQAMPAGGWLQAQHARIDDHFLATYDIRLLAGRGFDARDTDASERVVIVDRRLADRLWPEGDAVGRVLVANPQRESSDRLRVIGVVEPMHLEDADDPVLPILLVPLRQNPARFATLAVRVSGDASAFAPVLAEAVRAEDADTPVYWVRTQAQAIRMGRIGPVILTEVFSVVGLAALFLAAAGLYGVLAFVVEQRGRELGIRRAIGAGRRQIAEAVAGRLSWQVALGLGLGLLLAVPWSMLLEIPVLQTRGLDPLVFAGVALVVLLVALVACLPPLRRALRIDPAAALRSE